MIFSYENRDQLDKQYIHDSEFNGYRYDYNERKIIISCIDSFYKRRIQLIFCNVIFSEMQSCLFWYGGNSIYDIWLEKNSYQMQHLLKIQKSNKDKYDYNCLTEGINYLEIKIQINSGDTFFIICESLNWVEEAITGGVE